MLYNAFVLIVSMSITSSIVIAVVLTARLCMKKMPKIFSYLLWGIVLFRLLCPFSFHTPFSVMGNMNTEMISVLQSAGREVSLGEWKEQQYQEYYQKVTNYQQEENIAEKKKQEKYPEDINKESQFMEGIGEYTQIPTESISLDKISSYQDMTALTLPAKIISLLWLVGAVSFLVKGFLSDIRLKKKLTGAFLLEKNIYLCDYITEPFVLGVIKPHIYLPSSLGEEEKEYIILHERIHIRRGDHIFRFLAFLALALHWFNPFVWAAFFVSGMDMEMSCDETVMRKTGKDIRKEYASSLLNIAAGKKVFHGTLLAFGEQDTKGRIENIMNYKKHTAAFLLLAAGIVFALSILLGSNSQNVQEDNTAVNSYDSGSQGMSNKEETAQEMMQQEYRTDKVYQWADAFCSRNGERIVAMCSSQLAEQLEETEILYQGDTGTTFGFSSPWPDTYDVREVKESTAVIAYYAWTSEPHYTVWLEEIQFEAEDGFQVTGSELTYYDNIKTSEEFMTAYADGIEWTPLAYMRQDVGEALNRNALEKTNPAYEQLLDPEEAAVFLLNLNPQSVTIDVTWQEGYGRASLTLMFEDFGSSGQLIAIQMVQPYGTEGIWVPRDYPTEEETRWDSYKEYQSMLGEDFLQEFYQPVYTVTKDLYGDEKAEIIEVHTGNIGDGDSGFVLIKDSEGELLYNEFAHTARAGWNNIYLSDFAGDNFILTFHIEDRESYGSYSYQVYRIVGKDEIQILAENEFSFGEYDYDREEFRRFMEPLSRYLATSRLLLSTQEGEVRTDFESEAEKYSFENLVRD